MRNLGQSAIEQSTGYIERLPLAGRKLSAPVVLSLLYAGSMDFVVDADADPYSAIVRSRAIPQTERQSRRVLATGNLRPPPGPGVRATDRAAQRDSKAVTGL